MYITINNQTIYYQKVGQGKDLILLHGWGQDSSSFWGIVNDLKIDFSLWLLDLPGFGRSSLPQKPFTVSDYSEIIATFIKQLGLKKPSLLGHSLGGRVAIKLSVSHPELIDLLILEDSAGIKPKQDLVKPIIYLLAKAFRYLLPNFFNIKLRLRHLLYHSLEADYLNAGLMTKTLTNLLDEDLTPYLSKIENNTLILWGENDRAVPVTDGKKMYRLIPNSRLEILDNVGHFPHLENPERFVYYMKDFCTE